MKNANNRRAVTLWPENSGRVAKRVLYTVICIFLFVSGATSQTPVPLNPRTPAEYFPSKAVLIEWDFNPSTWDLYSALIRACREATEVIMVVRDADEEQDLTQLLIADSVPLTDISFVHVPCERMWIRDHGPLSVWTDTGVAFMDFDDLANSGLDENLPTNLANVWGLDSYSFPYILCGGNFMVDHQNTLFTTERLYTNNPGISRTEIDSALHTFMGIQNIVTVSAQHNDYWGHIDMQMKLLDDTTFVIASVSPASGPNYDTLENNFQKISSLTAPHGKPYRIRRLPMADDWKTYANALILNNTVLIPTYNHPNDSIAFLTYGELLPNHQLVDINCNSIIGWEGALHCITMQLFDDSLMSAVQPLSVNDRAIHFYPNPILRNRQGTLLWTKYPGQLQALTIYDQHGKIVRKVALENQSSPLELLWNHPPGIYYLSITSAKGSSLPLKLITVE